MELYFDDDDIQEIEDAITYWKNGGDESYGLHVASLVVEKYLDQLKEGKGKSKKNS